MKKTAQLFSFIADSLSRISKWLLVIIGAAMSLIVLLQVFFRFVIYVPFPWSEELARYLMIWMGMLGSFLAMRRGRHIGVTVIVERLPLPLQGIITFFIRIVLIAFLCIIAKEGLSLAFFNAAQNSPAMEVPMVFPYLAIPVGAALMIVQLITDILVEFWLPEAAGSVNTGGGAS